MLALSEVVRQRDARIVEEKGESLPQNQHGFDRLAERAFLQGALV